MFLLLQFDKIKFVSTNINLIHNSQSVVWLKQVITVINNKITKIT